MTLEKYIVLVSEYQRWPRRNMSAVDAAKVCALVASSLSDRRDLIWYWDDNIVSGEYAGRES